MPMPNETSKFSAPEQALGYLYQLRYALLEILRMPEETICYIERDDDVDFSDPEEGRILASLKHKTSGDTLTDLSPDFWKSVRIWLTDYLKDPDSTTPAKYFLITTGQVQTGSLLATFLPNAPIAPDITTRIATALDSSTSKTIKKTTKLLAELPQKKMATFFPSHYGLRHSGAD
jgi:hypothetical protein